VDLPTYTNIWRIEKRLYKLYDFRLPMPLPINWIAVFAGITVPYIILLVAIGLPFNHSLVWLYVLPPGLLTWLTTRPVIENKRLPELLESQVRYLAEPRVWCRLAPLNEKDEMVVTARVWHARQAQQRRKAARTKAAGTLALREQSALARHGVAAQALGDPAEGNAPLAAASALAAAPAAAAHSRSRARARGTGPQAPSPGSSGRQRPPGRRTRRPQQDWAAQQRQAAHQGEFPEETWPAGEPPRAQPKAPEDQAAKPSRFRLSALRPKPAGQPPALPPGVALRPPAEPRRPLPGTAPSDQAGGVRPWPEGPARPGQARPPWRMPAARSAPPLGSVLAPVSSDLPAHATPDIFPATLPLPDANPPAPVPAGLAGPGPDVHPASPADATPEALPAMPPVPDAAPDVDRSRADARIHPASSAHVFPASPAAPDAAPGIDPAGPEAGARPASPADVAPAVFPAPLASAAAPDAAPGIDPAGPEAVGYPASSADVAPEVDPASPAPSSGVRQAPADAEADPAAPSPAVPDGEPATSVHAVTEVDPAIQAPAAPDADLAAPEAPSAAGPAAPGLSAARPVPAPGAPRVEISHDGPARRPAPPAPVPPVNPAPAWPAAEPEPAGLSPFSAALTTENGSEPETPGDEAGSEEVTQVASPPEAPSPVEAPPPPVVTAVADAQPLAVLSIERALSGPSRDRNLTWHGKVKVVAGTGQGPGKRDQEALDRARARLPLKTPRRVLMLGCTSGAGQTVTTLMTGHILASLREEPVAAVDLHDGTLARYSAPAGWLEDLLSGKPPQGAVKARPDGLGPTPKAGPARLDVIASVNQLRDGDEMKLAVQLTRHYPLAMLDPGGAGLMKLLKITDQLVIVVPASIDGAGALADTRDWLDAHGFAELATHSVTVINGVSRRSLADVEQAESVARGRCRAIVRVPWDDMLPVEVADPSALRPQTRVAYTALAGVLVAGLAAAPVRTSQ
jgi:TcpE family